MTSPVDCCGMRTPLPLLMAHYDALRTGGYDPVEGKLTFLGEVPRGVRLSIDADRL